jgi:hypothetical protein
MKENMVERHPMKSYLKPEEVADMAAYYLRKSQINLRSNFEMDYGIVSFKI